MFYDDLFSKEEIDECMKMHNFKCSTDYVLNYWRKKSWKTLKGTYVRDVCTAISVANSIFIETENNKKKIKERRKSKKDKQRTVAINKIKKVDLLTDWVSYDAQLKDKKWLAFRDFILYVRGNKCEKCGSTNCLQIHHLHYNKGFMAWEYNCNEVVVLCKGCHMKEHKIK